MYMYIHMTLKFAYAQMICKKGKKQDLTTKQ